MKKRVISLVLALAMLLSISVTAGAAGRNYGNIPIYIGHSDVDYMAEEILKEIDTAGKSYKEQVRAVYNWVVKNCSAAGDGKLYFTEAGVDAEVDRYFYEECDAALQHGDILIRPDFDSAYNSSGVFYDASHYVANFAAEPMMKRSGSSINYAALMTVLLGHIGFDCRIVSGTANDSKAEHCWNYVLVNGEYLWLDVWYAIEDYADSGKVSYDCFLVDDISKWNTADRADGNYAEWLQENKDSIADDYGFTSAVAAGEPWSRCSNWALEQMEQAHEISLIPEVLQYTDLTEDISRGEFAAVAVAMYERLAGCDVPEYVGASPFTDCDDADVLRAYALGIVKGMGDGKYAPDRNLTREQAVTMLGRVYELVTTGKVSDGSGLGSEGVAKFSDDSSISAYARNYIYHFVSINVIQGVGNNKFAPKDSMTREAALKTALEAAK